MDVAGGQGQADDGGAEDDVDGAERGAGGEHLAVDLTAIRWCRRGLPAVGSHRRRPARASTVGKDRQNLTRSHASRAAASSRDGGRHRPDDVAAIGERRCPRSRRRRILGPWPPDHARAHRARVRRRPPDASPDATARERATAAAAPRGRRRRGARSRRRHRRGPRAARAPRSTRPPACSRPTARWSTSSTRRPATCASPTTPASGAGAAGPGSARSTCRSASGMFGARSPIGRSSSPTTTSPTPSSPTRPRPDRVVATSGIRSMVVAPLVSGEEVFGALGTFAHGRRPSAPSQIALVRALADHAAAAMANARLIEALDRPAASWPQRAEVERSLREIAARISAADRPAGGPPARASTRRPACSTPRAPGSTSSTRALGLLRWAYASGDSPARRRGVAGRPGRDARPGHLRPGGRHRPGVLDRRLPQGHALPARRSGGRATSPASGIHSVMAAPLDRRGRAVRGADGLQQPRRMRGPRRTRRCSRPSPTRPRSRSARRA